jgi:Tfp pilus assembly protein PilF
MTGVDSQALPPVQTSLQASALWPVRSGSVPALADRFSTRPETGPDLKLALGRTGAVMLAPRGRRVGAGSSQDWLRCSGKTQLAAFFAESQWRAGALDLLVWVDASSLPSILADYVDAAAVVTGTRSAGDAETVAASFLGWLAQTDRRWLVVLDDLTDPDSVAGRWPAGRTGQVIVTTSSTQAVSSAPDGMVLEIGPFSRREAMSYLVGRLSADPDQRRGAIDLIEDLDCHPIALAQATATIGGSWLTCVDYREHYYRRAGVLTPPGAAAPFAPAVTWTLAVDASDQPLPGGSAQTCLAMAALLDGHGIPMTIFATAAATTYIRGSQAPPRPPAQRESAEWGTGTSPAAAQQPGTASTALNVLDQAGLLTIDRGSDPPMVRMNTILQRAVRAATPREMQEAASLAAATALLEAWPDDDRVSRTGQVLRASAASLQRAAGATLWARGCHPLLLRAGKSLDDARLSGPAVDYWTGLMSIADQVIGPGHPDALVLVERLAGAYVAAGRAAEAVSWHQRMMADWARAFGPDHPRTLAARVSLGRVLVSAGIYEEAIRVMGAALADCERAYGPGHPECISIRTEVAAGYRAAGDLGEATRLYKAALDERERRFGSEHPDTMASRQVLAETYLAAGRTKDAFSQYKRVVTDRQRSQGKEHPDTLRATGALASAYQQAGKMAQAIQLSEQVRAGTEKALGPDHRDTLSAALVLATAYYTAGRLSDASTVFRDVIARGERVLSPTDPLTQSAREGLAAITGE